MRGFTVDEARAVLATLAPTLAEIVVVRANLPELGFALAQETAREGRLELSSPRGGLPELKAAQAHLDEMLTGIQDEGIQLKGFAPLLLDFPAWMDGEPILL